MGEMHGARRVVTFFLLTAVLPTTLLVIPLYLRHSLYADVSYSVAESDVIEAVEGISTIFCQEQILRMNSTFRAFQLEHMPPISNQKKHIQLKKSMILPDDTVEYWGFYLLAGSNITLHACSRFPGAGVLIVEGEKNLKTCNSLELLQKGVKYQKGNSQVHIPKIANSREIRASNLPRDSKLPQNYQINVNNSSSQIRKRSNSKAINEEPDALDELTQDLRKFIANYPHNKETPKYDSAELKPHLPINHVENSTAGLSTKSLGNLTELSTLNGDSRESVKHKRAVNQLAKQLQDLDVDMVGDSVEDLMRTKRRSVAPITGHVLDAAIGHGGNANVTEDLESSDSSFEESLRRCYEGQILDFKEIYPTHKCHNNYPINHSKIETVQITSDGYYYFIFYSDNDHNLNPVHAHFDLFKSTYMHTNYSRGCVNQTECKFPIAFWSSEIVIVEIPTQDGIEHEDGDASILVSSCYPRMSIYAIFPIAVLFLILGCAFM